MLWTLSEQGKNAHIIMQGTTSLLPAAQLVRLPAYQPAGLITCPHTEHLLSRSKGHGWGQGEILFVSTGIHFEKMCWVSLHCIPPKNLAAWLPSQLSSLFLLLFITLYLSAWIYESVHSSMTPNHWLCAYSGYRYPSLSASSCLLKTYLMHKQILIF